MKKIAYITGTRADYGAISSVLREINTSKDFDLYIIATGMHLMPEFGMTINEIRKDDYKIYVVNAVYEKDILSSTPKFISKFLNGLTEKLTEIKPDQLESLCRKESSFFKYFKDSNDELLKDVPMAAIYCPDGTLPGFCCKYLNDKTN